MIDQPLQYYREYSHTVRGEILWQLCIEDSPVKGYRSFRPALYICLGDMMMDFFAYRYLNEGEK